jgi:pimeloyl-ACP methyl ester carboxylesterase
VRLGWALPAILCAVLAAGCGPSTAARPARPAGRATAVPGPAGPAPATLAGYYQQRLRWVRCDKVFRCARLLVPFDYSRPAWRRFSLPVIELPAAHPAERIGALLVNPGGPGGSGVAYALQARTEIAAPVRARFDIVGFDPRGVGGSQPAVHCLTGPQLDKYFATDDMPKSAAQDGPIVAESKLFARGCEQDSGALLRYVGTRNAARDMDVLRAALGQAKLTYLGKSYGTYLGTWYARLFPSHVRALVLDGAINPASSGLSMNAVQAQGFQVALRAFISNCAKFADCPLGHPGMEAGLVRIQALLARATVHPLTNALDAQPANGAMLLNGIATALYNQAYWGTLRSALAAAFAGNGTVLVELANALFERSSSGQYSNLADAETAVDCLDRPWPSSLARWRAAAASAGRSAPVFGQAIMWGSLACAYWPVRSYPLTGSLRGSGGHAVLAAGAPPILVVGNLRDPATPYRWAQALSRDLASGVLLGWNGNGHTAYMMGSLCVDNIVNKYLISLAVPRSGTVCG